MRASELIEKLLETIVEHGDIKVTVPGGHGIYDVESVRAEELYTMGAGYYSRDQRKEEGTEIVLFID